ncbi:hypothetical protein [Thermomonospora umbrina]|uniref:hypothetical protein n=1 Tax=Thermomonospora umbrina TaxID=111806 RepID=UPI0011C114FD|nr:hypothetical protein [Thermomonospora umbrina]
MFDAHVLGASHIVDQFLVFRVAQSGTVGAADVPEVVVAGDRSPFAVAEALDHAAFIDPE